VFEFLAMRITVIQHLPYLDDLSAAFFLYFSKTQDGIKGRRFEDITMMQEKLWDTLAEFLTVHLMECCECGAISV